MPERQYPAGVVVENQLRVWAISRWRGERELAEYFLMQCYRHLSKGSPRMFQLQDYIDGYAGGNGGLVVRHYVTFTNSFDAYYLLGRVF
jgi:hypothetical protein